LNINDHEYTFKIALIGNEGTGKTSVIDRYIENKFNNNYQPTMGVNLLKTTKVLPNGEGGTDCVNLMIWDIAGQKKYERVRSMYFQGCRGVIFVYDMTRPDTYDDIREKWVKDYAAFAEPDSIIILIGNKKDLTDKIKIGTAMGYQLAAEIKAVEFFETSAKTGDNIQRLFEILIQKLIIKGAELRGK
jgi:small GTP-binding protein